MALFLEAVVGTFLAAIFLGVARAHPGRSERRLVALGLAVAALIYVGFAVVGGFSNRSAWNALPLEVAGLAGFGVIAWLGGSGRLSPKASVALLAAGWAAHTLWDLVVHGRPPAEYVPAWYPGVCLGFDLLVAFGVFSRIADSEGSTA